VIVGDWEAGVHVVEAARGEGLLARPA